jgi:hypothetical protein
MTTLNHEVWANPTTPLFLQSGASASNAAPLTLVSTPFPATRQTTITSTPTGGGGIYYAPIGSSDSQAYGYLRFANGGGWELLTNNVSQLFGYSGNIGANVPITISSPQSSSSLKITTTSIGVPNNPSTSVTFGNNQVFLGQHAVAQDGLGFSVTNTNDTKAGTLEPTTIAFSTSTLTPNTTTYTFSAETFPAQGFAPSSSVEGFSITCDIPAFTNGGATYTNPSLSAVAVTTSGTPPSSGKGLYMVTTTGTPNYLGNGYIEFPAITAPAGTTISVQWKQVGTYTYGKLYKNDVVLVDLLSLSGSSWTSSGSYTFTSSGDDRLYIQLNNFAAPLPTTNIYFNISDIAITQYSVSASTDALIGMNGSSVQMSNAASGAYVEARSSDGAAALYSSTGTGSSVVAATNIVLKTATGNAVTIDTPTLNLGTISNINLSNGGVIAYSTSPNQMFINGGSAQYLNIINGGASMQMTGGAIYLSGSGGLNMNSPVYMNSAALNMNNNNINGVGTIGASNVDGNGVALVVGLGSGANSVGVYNVNTLSGTLTSGGGTGFNISNCKMLNLSPACPPAVLFYTGNFGAYRQLSTTLLPALNARMTNVFPSDFVPDNWISFDYITIPAYSVFSLTGTTSFTQSNTNSIPQIYSLSGHSFSPTDGGQRYSLQPILV